MPAQLPPIDVTTLGALLLVGGLIAACKPSPEPAPPVATSHVDATAMFRHEVVARAVQDALARGDLDSSRRHARELSARATVDGSPEAIEGLQAMRSSALALTSATDIRTASVGMGRLVRTCADCHARLAGPIRLAVDSPPRRDSDPRSGMRRHGWAMNQLWNGLVGNAEDPWRAGASTLAEPSLAARELVPATADSREIDEIAATVERLGRRAATTSDVGLRSELYGELLATCGDCHARVRRPGGPQ